MSYPEKGCNSPEDGASDRYSVGVGEFGEAGHSYKVLGVERLLGSIVLDRIPQRFAVFQAESDGDVVAGAAGVTFATNNLPDATKLLHTSTAEQSTLELRDVSEAEFRSSLQPSMDLEMSEADANRWRLDQESASDAPVLQVAFPRDSQKGSSTILIPMVGDGSRSEPFEYHFFAGPQARGKTELPSLLLALCAHLCNEPETPVHTKVNGVDLQLALVSVSNWHPAVAIRATVKQPVPRTFTEIDTDFANGRKVLPTFETRYYYDCLNDPERSTNLEEWARWRLENNEFEIPEAWFTRTKEYLSVVR